MPGLWGHFGALFFELVDFISDGVGDLAAELDQKALQGLRSIEGSPG